MSVDTGCGILCAGTTVPVVAGEGFFEVLWQLRVELGNGTIPSRSCVGRRKKGRCLVGGSLRGKSVESCSLVVPVPLQPLPSRSVLTEIARPVTVNDSARRRVVWSTGGGRTFLVVASDIYRRSVQAIRLVRALHELKHLFELTCCISQYSMKTQL